MNYISQLNGFYGSLQINTLSSNAICLYGILLHINNKCGWKEQFTVSNLTLQGMSSLSRAQIDKARNELKTKGYIDYIKGSGNRTGKYLIVSLDTQIDTQTCTQDDTQTDTQSCTQALHKRSTLNKLNNKQNKTKPNKGKENIKEKPSVFGEYENVLLTETELSKLKNEFEDWESQIEKLSIYMASTGKKYANHLATIRAWNRKSNKKSGNPFLEMLNREGT